MKWKYMKSYKKMLKANISGIFATYIGCRQVKYLAKNMLFNAQSSNFFLMPLTFLQKRETHFIFLKETWTMGHWSKAIKVWCRNQPIKLIWADSSVELSWLFLFSLCWQEHFIDEPVPFSQQNFNRKVQKVTELYNYSVIF